VQADARLGSIVFELLTGGEGEVKLFNALALVDDEEALRLFLGPEAA